MAYKILNEIEKRALEILSKHGIKDVPTRCICMTSDRLRIEIPSASIPVIDVEYQSENIFVAGKGRVTYSEIFDISEENVKALGFPLEFFYQNLQPAIRELIALAEKQRIPDTPLKGEIFRVKTMWHIEEHGDGESFDHGYFSELPMVYTRLMLLESDAGISNDKDTGIISCGYHTATPVSVLVSDHTSNVYAFEPTKIIPDLPAIQDIRTKLSEKERIVLDLALSGK